MLKRWAVALLFLAALPVQAQVTFSGLLAEMGDLGRLAQYPSERYVTRQASSYDRRSTDPNAKTDENWFANGDRGKFIRIEKTARGNEHVLLDAKGPGAVVRIWSADPENGGLIRIYLDGAAEPTIEMPFDELLGGERFPFIAPIAGERAKGWNSHLPIPYAKSCKITAEKFEIYYHVNYRTYAPGTEVESFSMETARLTKDDVAAVATALQNVGMSEQAKSPLSQYTTLGPSAYFEQRGDTNAPRAIVGIRAHVKAENVDAALRAAVLEITFDDAPRPQIAVPLGDFFGGAPGTPAYRSMPCGISADGTMYANWVMPYRSSTRVRVTNHGDAPIEVALEMRKTPYIWDRDTMYFHADWRGEFDINTRPRRDWNYIEITGRGRFVGSMLHLTNPVGGWWGEGDEKIYLDGERFPSTFGTGTEDYYGYAWASPDLFSHAYHAQPRVDGPSNYGHTSVNRFHVIDDYPFNTAFRFDMEVWHWEACKVAMAATTYWYGAPGASSNRTRPERSLLRIADLPGHPSVEGAIEGESLRVINKSGGEIEIQNVANWGWSDWKQLWWRIGKPGDVLELGVPVERAGRYEVIGRFTEAPDYGVIQLSLNGTPLGSPIDFYAKDAAATDEIFLGEMNLPAGEAILTATIKGKNDNAVPDYMFGLDYLRLAPR